MTIIALVNQKGGCGKSTTAVHFSFYLRRFGSVVLIDADAQQSSSQWVQSLEEDSPPTKAILDPEELFDNIEEQSRHYDYLVIDGPGSLSSYQNNFGLC